MADTCPKCGAERFWGGLAEYRCGSIGEQQSARCKLTVAERDRDDAVRLLRNVFDVWSFAGWESLESEIAAFLDRIDAKAVQDE